MNTSQEEILSLQQKTLLSKEQIEKWFENRRQLAKQITRKAATNNTGEAAYFSLDSAGSATSFQDFTHNKEVESFRRKRKMQNESQFSNCTNGSEEFLCDSDLSSSSNFNMFPIGMRVNESAQDIVASFNVQVIADHSLIGSAEQDEIVSLPGITFPVKFKQYAGYLQGSETDFLHYWFVESQSSPASDPVVFWFNGGPGCSSIATGFLEEMGPFTMSVKALKQNPNAWNKQANVVFLDGPPGTGYSYSSSGIYKSSDSLTAQGNYEALKSFFRKFAAFRNHTLFVTGESYGGVSVPLFAEQIIDGQSQYPVNLGGVAVVNGLVEQKLRHWPYHDTVLNFVYSHGWLDEALWKKLETDCCKDMQNCPFFELEGDCKKLVDKAMDIISAFYGDTDLVCNFLMGQKFAENLQFKKTQQKQQWEFNGRTAGFKTLYEKNLTFATVLGAGHMAPGYRPPEMLYAINQFMKNEPF
uniref:Carboxypeptidase n=1 Tax=Ditylenchus dipsaci TaxID=166011 RepID=A0A915EBN6_9BILA